MVKTNRDIVFCPLCKVRIFDYDGFATNTYIVQCPKCKRFYKIATKNGYVDSIRVTNKPERQTASGAIFY